MNIPQFLYQAALIAAHTNGEVDGRTRLQKTIKLLQRIGYPTDYSYTIHFYGPFSEAVQSDNELLKQFGFIREIEQTVDEGYSKYLLQYVPNDKTNKRLPDIEQFKSAISLMENSSRVTLELAATYDAFIEQGADTEKALEWLKIKKGDKCTPHNLEMAFQLLNHLGLLQKQSQFTVVAQ